MFPLQHYDRDKDAEAIESSTKMFSDCIEELKGAQESSMTCFDLLHVILLYHAYHGLTAKTVYLLAILLLVCMSVVQIISRQVRYLRIAERHKSYNPCRWVRTAWTVCPQILGLSRINLD